MNAQENRIAIYDHYDYLSEDSFRNTKEYIELEEHDPNEGYVASDDEVWEEIYRDEAYQYDDLKKQLQSICDGRKLVFVGKLGLWNGTPSVGDYADDIADLFGKIVGRDSEIDKIFEEDGDLHVEAVHHDGRNRFVVRMLDDEGERIHDFGTVEPSCAEMFEKHGFKFEAAEKLGYAQPKRDLATIAEQAKEASRSDERTDSIKERDER